MARSLLWKGNEERLGGHYLINWQTICLPKSMEVWVFEDFKLQNTTLLIRWPLKLESNDQSFWTITIKGFYAQQPLATNIFFLFLADLKDLYLLFQISTTRANDGSLIWRWTSNKNYSSVSTYKFLSDPRVQSPFATVL